MLKGGLLLAVLAAGCGGQQTSRSSNASLDGDHSNAVLAFASAEDDAVWTVGPDWQAGRLASPAWSPDWSPDGAKIAYWTRRALVIRDVFAGARYEAFKAALLQGEDVDPFFEVPSAAWASRHGDIAVVLSRRVPDCPDCPAIASLGVANLRDFAIARIYDEQGFGLDIAYASHVDGRQVAYAQCRRVGPGGHGEFDCTLFVVGVHGRRRRPLLTHIARPDLAWAPHGGSIAVATQLRSGSDEGDTIAGSDGLYVVTPPRHRVRLVHANVTAFSWSPDGRELAYIDGEGRKIFRISADGTRRREIMTSPQTLLYEGLWWSRAGNVIAVEAARRSDYETVGLHFIDSETGAVLHRIRTGDVASLSWRPR